MHGKCAYDDGWMSRLANCGVQGEMIDGRRVRKEQLDKIQCRNFLFRGFDCLTTLGGATTLGITPT